MCMLFDLLFAGSYQPRIGGGDGKKTVGKVGSKGSVLGDQPVVFHKTIKSSGYGKEQPVMLLLLLLLLPLPTNPQVMRMFGAKAPPSKKKPTHGSASGGGLAAAQYDMESNAPVHRQVVDGWSERDRLHR